MSWVIAQLRANLASKRSALTSLLETGDIQSAFNLANSVAQSTGRVFGVEMMLHFPAGAPLPSNPSLFGTSNIGIIIDKARKKFERVTEASVRAEAARIDEDGRLEPTAHGYEGFHLITSGGRMTVLPGALYIWLPIGERVEAFLDWLFVNAYDLAPPVD